jgi:uncharacterized protein (TIGR03437 family)
MKLAAPGQVFRQLKNQVVDFGRVRHGMFRRNYVVPSDTALGSASVTVTSSDGSVSSGRLEIQSVAPGIFTLCCAEEFFDDDGIVPAGQVIRIRDGVRSAAPLFEVNAAGKLRRLPVELRDTDDAYLVLYGTGLRFRSSLANVIPGGGEVVYAGPQGEFPGLDQINLRIRGGSGVRSGWWSLRFTVDGRMLSAGSIVFN